MIEKIIYLTLILMIVGSLIFCSTANEKSPLNKFLHEQELDNLIDLRSKISKLNKNDRILINSLLSDWNKKQAISNLLFYPVLIPIENRFDAIEKGLTDKKTVYYNLASIVGIQSPEDLQFNKEELLKLKRLLFEHVKKSNEIIALRSTSSLTNYINTKDFDEILECASNRKDAVQTNLLSMIVSLYGKENIKEILENNNSKSKLGIENLLSELEKQELKIKNAPIEKQNFFKSILGAPVMGYIPNLNDFE